CFFLGFPMKLKHIALLIASMGVSVPSVYAQTIAGAGASAVRGTAEGTIAELCNPANTIIHYQADSTLGGGDVTRIICTASAGGATLDCSSDSNGGSYRAFTVGRAGGDAFLAAAAINRPTTTCTSTVVPATTVPFTNPSRTYSQVISGCGVEAAPAPVKL